MTQGDSEVSVSETGGHRSMRAVRFVTGRTGVVLLVLICKAVLLCLFSSDYQDRLFVPFIYRFLEHGGNPWQWFYQEPAGAEFPYQPLMLYLMALFYWPVLAFKIAAPAVQNLFFKIPILVADLVIFGLLLRVFPRKGTQAFVFYFCSPIVLYASYLHRSEERRVGKEC
jgi:hypothetical protein